MYSKSARGASQKAPGDECGIQDNLRMLIFFPANEKRVCILCGPVRNDFFVFTISVPFLPQNMNFKDIMD